MQIVKTVEQLREKVRRVKRAGKLVGFVPTMGALHDGHLSLIRKARKENDCVVVSIFVNPTQFGPKEDFKKYPRDLSHDAKLCRQEKVNFLFCPEAREMYSPDYATFVEVKELSGCLCGRSRKGHFKGVATVVAKLFNIVLPDSSYFGQKDAQQAAIIRRMAEDLNFPLKIKIMPTLRDKDGLALSSRNAYLTATQRKQAVALFKALELARKLIKGGERKSKRVKQQMYMMLKKTPSFRMDYIAVVDCKGLKPQDKIRDNTLIALAGWVGKTRLIDNTVIKL